MSPQKLKLSPLALRMCAGYLLSDGREEIEQISWRMPASIAVDRLTSAWQVVVDKNPCLRVRLLENGLNSDELVVEPRVEVAITTETANGDLDDSAYLANWMAGLKADVMRVDQAPVFRLNLLIGTTGQILVWTFPHFILDGRSISIVLREVASLLVAEKIDPTVVVASELYAPGEGDGENRASLEWWKGYLGSYQGAKPLPQPALLVDLDSEPTHAHSVVRRKLDAAKSEKVREFARSKNVGIGTLAQLTWSLVLKSYLAESSVVFGSVRACRYRRGERDDRLGVMMNIVPFRVTFAAEDTIDSVIKKIRVDQLAIREHERANLSAIEKVADVPPSERLFETFLMVDHEFPWAAALKVLGPDHQFAIRETPSAGLVLTVRDEREIDTTVYSKDESVSPDTAREMQELFLHILEQLPERGSARVTELELIAPSDRDRSVTKYNDKAKSFPTGRLLQQSFEEIAARDPGLTAVIGSDRTLTYGELDAEANRLANVLVARGVKPGGLCVVRIERSSRLIVALLAVLKAGCGYVPLDPGWPDDRVSFIIESTKAEAVISSSELLSPKLRTDRTVLLDQLGSALASASAERPEISVRDDAIAYIIFTSGSTGTPKGVVIDHRGVVNTINDCNTQYQVTTRDRAFGISACTFDLSVYDIFGMLSAGAGLVVCPGHALRDPDTWGQLIKQHGVTIWNSVPQLAEMLFESLREQPQLLASLRLVMMSGDWIPIGLPDRIREVRPDIELWSLGGATEASIWSIWRPIHAVDANWKSIPYGYPMANQEFYVLDENLNPCPTLVAGDLYIGGVGLAKGYWADPQKTAAAFMVHPRWNKRIYKTGDMGRFLPSGEIEFLGRKDTQVKLGGFRIELGEIEAVLTRHPQIRDVVVTKAQLSDNAEGLAAYAIVHPGPELTLESVREFAREKLPEYMLPSALVLLEKFPLSSNGKVDRKALPEARAARPAAIADPSERWEPALRKMAKLWQETTGQMVDSPTKTFFQAGGTSLLALRLIEKVKVASGYRLKLADLYRKDATLAALAAKIFTEPAKETKPAMIDMPDWWIPVRSKGTLPPFFFFGEFLDMGRLFHDEQPFYGLLLAVDHRGEHPNVAFKDLATEKVRLIKSVQPQGPYYIGGYCFAGVLAVEVAAQLLAQGDEVRHLALFELPVVRSVGVVKRPWYHRFAWAFRRRFFEARRSPEEIAAQRAKTKEFEQLMDRLAFRNGDPFYDYVPQFLDLEVDYYVCRNSPYRFMPSSDPRNGWFKWFSKVRVHEIAGNHHTFLRTPTLEESVGLIEANLRRAQGTGKVEAGQQLISV